MQIYKTFDVIVVPYPFVDSHQTKNRPVVVLSSRSYFNQQSNNLICAMITSSTKDPWPLDFSISDIKSCGLTKASLIRLKIFTIDNRLIKACIGQLSQPDQFALQEKMVMTFHELLAGS